MDYEQLSRKIGELSSKIEYLFEHPTIIDIQKQVEDLKESVEDLYNLVEELSNKISEIENKGEIKICREIHQQK